jgi:hypothetical protein
MYLLILVKKLKSLVTFSQAGFIFRSRSSLVLSRVSCILWALSKTIVVSLSDRRPRRTGPRRGAAVPATSELVAASRTMKLSVSAYRAHASAHKKILDTAYQLNYGSTSASSHQHAPPVGLPTCSAFQVNPTFVEAPFSTPTPTLSMIHGETANSSEPSP